METQLLTKAEAAAAEAPALNRVPRATYRLQLRPEFGFGEVRELVPYLSRLGVSELYFSPLFRAREESSHGYDVVDHGAIQPDFGGMDGFVAAAAAAQEHEMGIVLDVVPNHMGINDPGNRWWRDVLENGPAARFADYFDIDWSPPAENLKGKVLLPFLGRPFGETLESGEIQLTYDDHRFQIAYFDRRFPVSPRTWPPILTRMLLHGSMPDGAADRQELESIATQLRHLPPPGDPTGAAARERYREQRIAARRLSMLHDESPPVQEALRTTLAEYNGQQGDPKSFDLLEDLLSEQFYRLAFWRVAVDEINYRRFFDINDLAAVRVEIPEVFDAVHELVFRLLRDGLITGLRVDHPDGLLDPLEYFRELQAAYRRCRAGEDGEEGGPELLYVVAEKILSAGEELREDWPVSGSTGYDLLGEIGSVLVDASGVARLRDRYAELSGVTHPPRDVIYQSKLTVLQTAMSSELNVLASQLYRMAQADRGSCDFTLPVLLRALREVIACFPVYRTYVRPRGWDVRDEDRLRIMSAVRWAKRRNPTMPWTAFEYLASVLLLEFPPYLSDEQREAWRRLALKLQQVTGPVTAKGLEDTAFYRYYPLASLNEVGGELECQGLELDELHRRMRHRAAQWPHSLSATATHDTKRGEDVRARLHVLSEIPSQWAEQVLHWNELCAPRLAEVDGEPTPGANELYLFYQTVLGTWPLEAPDDRGWEEYVGRITAYMEKALREAKVHTSWLNPSEEYETVVRTALNKLLTEDRQGRFLREMDALARVIAGAGFVNSLAQLVLKTALPGVPDFYQGCEFWDFRLVDPDNRRPVDFAARRAALESLASRHAEEPDSLLQELAQGWDNRLKLFATWRCLQLRARLHDVFSHGEYVPLSVEGRFREHVISFARLAGETWVVAVTARHPFGLRQRAPDQAEVDGPRRFCGDLWDDTQIVLPDRAPHEWTEGISGRSVAAEAESLPLREVFSLLPAALLAASG